MTLPILQFKNQYSFLSNFYPVEFVWDNIVWHHSEGAYQAAKTLDCEERLKISKMISPVTAKRAGKRIQLRSDWEEVKVGVMHEIVKAKFNQNPHLKVMLIDTGDADLEEGNTWNDRIWGICPLGSSQGLNYLGEILMSLRDDFSTTKS